jgi:hypothetical protein
VEAAGEADTLPVQERADDAQRLLEAVDAMLGRNRECECATSGVTGGTAELVEAGCRAWLFVARRLSTVSEGTLSA